MFFERRVVDNRVFLLGLDKLYRDAMEHHERTELLLCARRVAAALQVAPADVPVEGYYAKDEQLTEYFRLMRALQNLDQGHESAVTLLAEFQRLREVASAPLYGHPQQRGKLLPVGRDSLSVALDNTAPEWTVHGLTEAAFAAARETNDFSLVGLAARARDAVAMTATRESVVLYAQTVVAVAFLRRRPRYVWRVDEDLAEQARRFINTFNALFGEELPPPEPAHAERYWHACNNNDIVGRCVRLGYNDTVSPTLQYHWAVCLKANGEYTVQEFWHSEVWTTTRYRSTLRSDGRCPDL